MNKFKFGGLNHKGVYVDQTSMRQTYNFRNVFSRLSSEWVKVGDKKRAIEVLDKCMEELPIENIPMNYYFLQIVEGYYAGGDPVKAKFWNDKLLKQCSEELRYYSKYKGKNFKEVKQDAGLDIQAFQISMNMAQRNGQADYAKEIEKQMAEFNDLNQYFYDQR